MGDWFRRQTDHHGLVCFRGAMQPALHELAFLERHGIQMRPGPGGGGDQLWSLSLRHPRWGEATAYCRAHPHPLSRVLVDFELGLTPAERDALAGCSAFVAVTVAGQRTHVLQDRKLLLRFLHAVLGEDGLAVWDLTSSRFWSRRDLEEELAHDADLDIQALYSLHAITPDDLQLAAPTADDHVTWLHTHGLANIGFFDFDVLNPSAELFGRCRDLIRALAFAIVEQRVRVGTPCFSLARPDGEIALVDVRDFLRRARPADAALRTPFDPEHDRQRCVVCAPQRGWRRWLFRSARPSPFLAGPLPDEQLIDFSTAAGRLMAARAQQTYPVLCRLCAQFAEFDFLTLVKLGYAADGRPDDLEHLWFEVHGLSAQTIDATLTNQPFHIARMHPGQRGPHDVALLTDWMISTPFGAIRPYDLRPARTVQERADDLRRYLREHPPART